ncbi:MAG: phenylacetate--CoA ligase [Syntrophales bacterium]|jgi:phenylacetate-CoA ligase|nr:phenylacetate--CoA ligase [Syntrophales bacterium]
MFWEKDIETMDGDQLYRMQLERLRNTVESASRSSYYGKLFKEKDIHVENIKTLADLRNIPMTTKEDLRKEWPYGFLAASKDDIVRMHSSSGTTGRATVIFHTMKDIDCWTNQLARCMYMAGLRKSDVFQNMMTYALFTGGLGFHYGAEKLGAMVIPAGPGNSKRQIQLMRDFDTTAIHIIPSYALHLTTVFEEVGVDPIKDTRLRIAFIGAEPHSEKMRRRIEDFYGVKSFNSYGLSEMSGPGVAFECPEQNGLHIWEDAYLVEIIDPVTLEPLPDGQEGELVMTTLNREGMPILRYRTQDLTRIIPGTCPCGRTHRRIERIKGRTDDMMILKGVNIFPIQIEKKLMDIAGVGNNFQIILERKGFNDDMIVKVEVQREYFTGDLKELESLRRTIVNELKSDILITPRVELVEPESLPRTEGKAKRVLDNRED